MSVHEDGALSSFRQRRTKADLILDMVDDFKVGRDQLSSRDEAGLTTSEWDEQAEQHRRDLGPMKSMKAKRSIKQKKRLYALEWSHHRASRKKRRRKRRNAIANKS